MIVAAVRQLADWLTDATHGVNVQLATVPGDGGDTPPAAVTVWDAARHDWVARGQVPRDRTGSGPLLLVRGPDEAELPLFAGQDGGGWTDLELLVAYVHRPGITTASDRALRDAYETLRAAARSLALQFPTLQASPERARVSFERPRARFLAEISTLAGEETVLATLVVSLPAFDAWALGTT